MPLADDRATASVGAAVISGMRPHLILTAIFAIGGFTPPALARDGSFAVSVQVIDRRAAPALLDAIPVPPQARIFDAGGSGRSYAYPGTPEAAAAFFDAEMSRRGYRALSRRGNDDVVQQVWADDQARVLLHLRRALGSTAITRIRIDVSAAPRRPEALELATARTSIP